MRVMPKQFPLVETDCTQRDAVVLRSPMLDAAGFVHAFSTRMGGVSAAPFDALNLQSLQANARIASGEPRDDDDALRENHARFTRAIGLARDARVVDASQVHGCTVVAARDGLRARPEADALTSVRGGDAILMRVMDGLMSIPSVLLAIALMALTKASLENVVLAIAIAEVPRVTRLVRGVVLGLREQPFVEAAIATGTSTARILVRHILPNAMVATLTFLPFTLSGSVTILASLDFLGFGLPPGSPSLGELVSQGKNNLQAPWLGITAFLVLGSLLTMLIFIGEAVRDAFDPRRAAS